MRPFEVFGFSEAMAANAHGHKGTISNVDILIRHEDLQRFKAQCIGRGMPAGGLVPARRNRFGAISIALHLISSRSYESNGYLVVRFL
jgi:hypothetical protein